MYTDDLIDSKSDFNSAFRDRFPEGRIWIYFLIVFNSFQSSNEEKWVVAEGRGSIVKFSGTSFEGEGFLKTPQDSSINDGNQNGTENQTKMR